MQRPSITPQKSSNYPIWGNYPRVGNPCFRLSVFRVEKRTTNDLESFHANLKRKFKSHNPNYWDFIRNLNKVIRTIETDMQRIYNDVPIRRKKRPIVIQKEKIIENLQKKISTGELTSNDYLITITHHYKHHFKKYEGLIQSIEEVDETNEVEVLVQSEENPRSVVPNGGSPALGGRLLASGGRCKGRGAVVGVEKRGGAE